MARCPHLLAGERFKIQEAVETEGEGPVGQVIARSKKELIIATGQEPFL